MLQIQWQRQVPRGSRGLARTALLQSGHNRWSKIRHDKAKVDVGVIVIVLMLIIEAGVTRQRAAITQELQQASKAFGPDPHHNSRLAAVLVSAKKQSLPKHTIENAIARGQGVSSNGKPLESLVIEAMLPGAVALIVECLTDSRNRTRNDIRLLCKDAGGSLSPTVHLFQKKGQIILANPDGMHEDEILEDAVEAGAEDLHAPDPHRLEVITAATQTSTVAATLSERLGLRVESAELTWIPNLETMVVPDEPDLLQEFLDGLRDEPAVQAVYVNVPAQNSAE